MAARSFLWLLALSFVSCSKKEPEKVQLFYGACQIEVKSSVKHSEILIDGIEVGEHGHAKESVPCGWRQIRVESEGFEAVQEYHEVSAGSPASIEVKLEKSKKPHNYALSSQFIKDIKAGNFSDKVKEEAPSAAPEAPAAAPESPAAQSPVTETK
ncbi:MAG: PEGA domain-containing protein [Proteobacteria bacterium]|nr:PEGA domain-containing protein [Pseudomonadota bacterium]